jgi:O-methyltransferase involved in polyketide biosynthesis
MLAPLWARAAETRRSSPLLSDWSAVTTAGSLDFDFERLRLPRTTVVGACARTLIIDQMVRSCCQTAPGLLLVNLGEGLDNRFGRVDNGTISCLDVDLPEVIRLRANLIGESPRRRLVASSILDTTWMDEIRPRYHTILLVAEGVLMYLFEGDVRALFSRIAERFPGAEILFDTFAPGMTRFGAGFEMGSLVGASYRWGVRHAVELETWAAGYKLIERRSVFDSHRRHFGFLLRTAARISPSVVWAHSINRMRLGNSPASLALS